MLQEQELLVNAYHSSSDEYREAFRLFLDHTDQKVRAREWLDRIVRCLPSRRTFIDAGAGTGMVTAWFADRFEKTVALEPNPALCEELQRTCPGAEVLGQTILAASPPTPADLVLCSHVLYYVDRREWQAHLTRMASWLSSDGELVVVLQSSDTDCMKMLAHFHGQRFDLHTMAREFDKEHADHFSTGIESMPASVTTPDLDTAVAIAEFMLNLLPMPEPPVRARLAEYVMDRFATPSGYRFSCDQLFLRIAPNGRAGARHERIVGP